MHTTHRHDMQEQTTSPAHACSVQHGPTHEQLQETVFSLWCFSFGGLICSARQSLLRQDSRSRHMRLLLANLDETQILIPPCLQTQQGYAQSWPGQLVGMNRWSRMPLQHIQIHHKTDHVSEIQLNDVYKASLWAIQHLHCRPWLSAMNVIYSHANEDSMNIFIYHGMHILQFVATIFCWEHHHTHNQSCTTTPHSAVECAAVSVSSMDLADNYHQDLLKGRKAPNLVRRWEEHWHFHWQRNNRWVYQFSRVQSAEHCSVATTEVTSKTTAVMHCM